MVRSEFRKVWIVLLCLTVLFPPLGTALASGSGEHEAAAWSASLVNPGFESETGEDGTIPGWTQTLGVGRNGSVSVSQDVYAEGTSSLQIVDNDNVNFAVESVKVGVQPQTVYRASANVYIAGGSVQLQIRFYDAGGKLISGGIIVHDPNYTTSPSGVWQQLTVQGEAPADAAAASVVAVSGKGAKGTSYWDSFVLEAVPDEPAEPGEPADPEEPEDPEEPASGIYDELQNAGFDLPSEDGSIPYWERAFGTQPIVLDSIHVYEGVYSLKLADQSKDEPLGLISKPVRVTPGNIVTVTAMVYGEGTGTAELYLRYFDASGNIIGNHNQPIPQPGNEWQKVTLSVQVPEDAVTGKVLLYSSKSNQGTFYFDALAWEEQGVPNLFVRNGGFENVLPDGTIPGWKLVSGDASISQDQAFEGVSSLFISNAAGTGKGINLESDWIDVEEGVNYTLTANVFLQQGAFQGFYVYVYDENGQLVKGPSGSDFHLYVHALSPTNEWTLVSGSFTVQPGGKKAKVSLISGNKKNYQVYIDDVSILQSVANGGFEEQLAEDGSVPGWRKFAATDGDTFGVTEERAATGTKSLVIENDPGKYMNVIGNLIPVEAGKTYTAAAKTYIEYGSAGMYVRYFDRNGNYIGKQHWSITSEPAETWFTNVVIAEVPEGASYAAVMFAGSNKYTYKYYVDDVTFIKGKHPVAEEPPVPENSIVNVGVDLGVQIRKATVMRGDLGKDAEGRDVIYTVVQGTPAMLTVIDVETEQVTGSIPMPDTSGAWSVKVSSDGTVYLGAYNKGLLYRYFPETGELRNLGHPLPTKDSVLYPMDTGPDGKMYGGTYPTGSVYMYDPATDTFADFGTMAYTTSGERWTRVTVYDAERNKIYAGVGNQARLIEYDVETGQKRDLLPEKYRNITSVYDLNLVEGKLFARKETNNAFETFVLDAETGEQITVTNGDTGEQSDVFLNYSRGVSPKSPVADKVYFAGAGGELFEYDLNTDTYRSLGVTIEGAAISYDFVQLDEEGFPGYSLVGLSGNNGKMYKYNLETGNIKVVDVMLPAEPVPIHDIEKGPDGNIYTTGYLAGNMGMYNPATGESRYFNGIGQGEGMTVVGDKLYIGTYPDAKIYEYDVSKPWNRDNPDQMNPVLLFSLYDNDDIPGYTLQDRPFGMAGSEELGQLYVGTVPKNGLLGGAFAVYDLKTRGEPEVYWNLVEGQSIISLVYKDGYVYGGTSIHGGQGSIPSASEAVLFVWDAAGKQKVFETVPVPGKTSITALHAGPDGNIWGLANGALFVFDPVQRKVIYSKDEFPNASGRWIDGSLVTGTDGNIYGTAGGNFFKVDVDTKEVTVLATQARHVEVDDYGHFYLYPIDGANLYRYTIPDLVIPPGDVPQDPAEPQEPSDPDDRDDAEDRDDAGDRDDDRDRDDSQVPSEPQDPAGPGEGRIIADPDDMVGKDGKVRIELGAEHREVWLPAAAVEKIEGEVLEIAGNHASVEIPANLLHDMTAALKTAEGGYIVLILDELDETRQAEQMEKAKSRAGKAFVRSAGRMIRVELAVVDEEGQPVTHGSFHQPVTLRFRIGEDADAGLLGIYLAGEDGTLEYTGGMRDGAVLESGVTRSGVYMLLEYDRTYADVPETHWAYEAVRILSAKHVVQGVSAEHFAPSETMTRAQFVAMLARAFGLGGTVPAETRVFTDVDPDGWYYQDVMLAVQAGIVQGTGGGRFAPDEPVTREQMVVMLVRAWEQAYGPAEWNRPGTMVFHDADQVSDWAYEAVNFAAANGWIRGKGGAVLAPAEAATRAEGAAMLVNALDHLYR